MVKPILILLHFAVPTYSETFHLNANALQGFYETGGKCQLMLSGDEILVKESCKEVLRKIKQG